MVVVEHTDVLAKSVEQKMNEDLINYEHGHGVDVNYKKFFLVMKEETTVVGVLTAYTAFAEVYVDDLWVDSTHRGKGHGRKLLQELETRFKGKGFNNINLVTSAFQAPKFYKKCGFQVEFVRENRKNPKFTKTFFVKYFNEEEETQGMFRDEQAFG